MDEYDQKELDEEIDLEMGWSQRKPGEKRGDSPRRNPAYWQALLHTAKVTSSPVWRAIGKVMRGIRSVAFFPLISPLGYSKHFDVNGDMVIVKRSLFWRLCDGIITRALLTPVILAVFFVGMVYASTHPRAVQALSTPDTFGIYFKRVDLVTVDNQRLTGWLIPPYNAQQVALDPEGTLTQKWPGVVICHGLGASHDQYLALAQQLNAKGFTVLMVDTRGQGESDTGVVTYGLRERMDVLAGVKYLRETPYVDGTKVCVVGHDIGAIAALQATSLDSSITAVVADGLWPSFEDRAREIFSRMPETTGGGQLPTQWMAPLYMVAFEISVRDRLSQLNPEAIVRGIHTQPVLFIARNGADYLPVAHVLTLATNAGGRHEVYVDDPHSVGDTDSRTVDFLVQATGWHGPKLRGSRELEQMMQQQVPAGK
jgi:hypothetical protein